MPEWNLDTLLTHAAASMKDYVVDFSLELASWFLVPNMYQVSFYVAQESYHQLVVQRFWNQFLKEHCMIWSLLTKPIP